MQGPVHIIGGGLAGTEAAWQLARRGVASRLYEMRPVRVTPAHRTDRLAELVCSNSLKTDTANTAPWLLKEELRRLGSLLLQAAASARVPGGQALTVDREIFAEAVTCAVENEALIEIVREEVTALPDGVCIVASGPLTSDALAEEIARLTGSGRLSFYDSISPIVDASTIDRNIAFAASRHGKSLDGGDDYLNCPLDRGQYEAFVDALLAGEQVPAHIEQDNPCYFEACLPIEVLARRGRETLRFGPMKPTGLTDPRTGRWPYAAVQLRQENLRADSYNLVGFQNYLRFGEQKRILRMIPGLENAEFLRYGQIHRNTYINAPSLLTPLLSMRREPHVFFAGQICGIEGYVESIATGLVAGLAAADLVQGAVPRPFPRESAVGSLCHYVSGAEARNYQPANIAFDLLPPVDGFRRDRQARHAAICRRALESLEAHVHAVA
ncbi:MAG: methylenetetrahydrofolate--tRNA-(uracil(54)-C(5))-methyltransferase (FADH(2)-oxidizing) TrmFO [Bryobacterales bacterium]|nr:methylenetetrahydrofolate--tRNA-(uracil(54)-C(5))-methyltransferase (FADH(2)-oxidizing) TrmFO [Bryobacterales bacterium]